MNHLSSDSEARDRAKRLYQFVRELVSLRRVPVRACRNYEQCVPLDDLPPPPACLFIARGDFGDDDGDKWLEVRCPKLESYPEPPAVLYDWLDPSELRNAKLEMPQLSSGTQVDAEEEPFDDEAGGEDHEQVDELSVRESEPPAEIKKAWEQYVQDHWWPWAERTAPQYRAKELYDHLFRMYQRQEHLGETYEVVVGLGLLTWRLSQAVEVQRHLITAELSIELDSGRQVLTLGPTASGVQPRLEDDMLDPTQWPRTVLRDRVKERLRALDGNLWSLDGVHALLQEYCHALSPDSRYEGSYSAPKVCTEAPVVTFAPALILRRRGNDELLGLLDAIIKHIEEGGDIPSSVLRQVRMQPPGVRSESGEERTASGEDDELYFPMPANREQRRIAEYLNIADGVVVEGPPGTGKSQSIANLICHLLAIGKRVLVTSHTARALQVLRDKIPEPIRPLCVQALSDDAKGMQALEFSVKGITDHYNKWNVEDSSTEAERLAHELQAARETLQEAIHKQRALRESEVFQHEGVAGSYSGTLAQIARRLSAEREQIGIITDSIGAGQVPPCPVHEFRELLAALVADPSQISIAEASECPDVSCLCSPDLFDRLVQDIHGLASEVVAKGEPADSEIDGRIRSLASATRRELAGRIDRFANQLADLRRQRVEVWLDRAVADIFGGRDRAWRVLLEDSRAKIEAIRSLPREALEMQVGGLEGRSLDELLAQARTLLAYLKNRNGRGPGFWLLIPRHIKHALDVLRSVRVRGQACDSLAPLEALVRWAEAACTLESLGREWAFAEEPQQGSLRRRVELYEDACEPVAELLRLSDEACELSARLVNECGDCGPVWRDSDEVRAYLDAFSRVDALSCLEEKRSELDASVNAAGALARAHPGIAPLRNLAVALADRDAAAYRRAYQALSSDRAQWERSIAAANTLQRIARSAPELATRLKECPGDQIWQALADRWDAAWAWAAARTWLAEMTDPEAGHRAASLVAEAQKRIQDLIASLASVRAWGHCFRRLTEEQRQRLEAWSLAVKRIGKGTGKFANQHRQAARQHLGYCQSAIPAWIMPVYRVAESIRPGHSRFDVAIIDEASQSGLEALALLFLADKIVVVGDEKQISPEPFNQASTDNANRLRRDLVSDLPANDALDPQSSFFDLAKIRYPNRVRLVEHFRCMPEIIQFSNDLCYKAEPLIPLRQFGAGRLEPVVNAVHVPQGFNKGRSQKTNPPEARAVAQKVADLLKDSRYDGKTFGVISLLGNRQHRLIENEIYELVSPNELRERLCVCGEAYAFQGAERDVILLSMVSAPNSDSRIGVLGGTRDAQRFNVAMSRARDQVWLFHSVTSNDLSPKDLRSDLLRYCQNPAPKPEAISGLHLDELRRQARDADRVVDKPPGAFGSWFEVDVCLGIAAEGYLIIPQYEVSGYRIDLAIVGGKGKLALECDGDYWHGPEQWERDAARQRDLERCGWPFVRLRESAFYLDPMAALRRVRDELRRQGIRPMGTDVEPEADAWAESASCKENESAIAEIEPAVSGSAEETKARAGQLPALQPYDEWVAGPLPDPRRAAPESVIRGLTAIVESEGPATWRRILDCYRISLGLGRLKGPTREALKQAARRADETGRLSVWPEVDSGDWYDHVVHVPGSPRVKVRQRGPRSLEDVPCSEIAELMRMLDLLNLDEEWCFRQVLSAYGLRRLTDRARSHLSHAARMARNQLPAASS